MDKSASALTLGTATSIEQRGYYPTPGRGYSGINELSVGLLIPSHWRDEVRNLTGPSFKNRDGEFPGMKKHRLLSLRQVVRRASEQGRGHTHAHTNPQEWECSARLTMLSKTLRSGQIKPVWDEVLSLLNVGHAFMWKKVHCYMF